LGDSVDPGWKRGGGFLRSEKDKEKDTKMMAPFRHVVLRFSLSSIIFEHHSSNSQRTENISVEEQMRGPGVPVPMENKENIKQKGGMRGHWHALGM
jgi:hypothetical protein